MEGSTSLSILPYKVALTRRDRSTLQERERPLIRDSPSEAGVLPPGLVHVLSRVLRFQRTAGPAAGG